VDRVHLQERLALTPSLRLWAVALLWLPAGVWAQSTYRTRALPPGGWDLRFSLEADGLLAHAGANASGEVGLFHVGEGSIAVGVEAALGHCLTSCGNEPGLEVSRWAAAPLARVAWHFVVASDSTNASEVDLYLVALGGAGFVFQEAQEGGVRLGSAGVVPLWGGGVGSVYFPGNGEGVFAGGELRLLYSPRLPLADPAAGGGLATLDAWSLRGLRFMFSMGIRL